MQDEERALLGDVAEDLGSEAPRLAYAAWLRAERRGWGDFIEQAIAAGPSPSGAAGKALDKLLRAHAKDGLGAAYPFADRKLWAFDRGFPLHLSTNAAALSKCAEEVGLRAPGAKLHLAAVKEKHLDALAPYTAGFRGGELYVHELKDRGVKHLCDSGMLAGFGDVKLFDGTFQAEGVAALAGCASAGAVRDLCIDHWIDAAPLFSSSALAGLRSLTIHSARLTEGLRKSRRALGALKVGGLDDFDDTDARLLSESPSAAELGTLSLARSTAASEQPTGLTRRGLLEMVAALPRLHGLWLYGFHLSEELAADVTAAFKAPHGRIQVG